MSTGGPDLFVICKSCGSEVSPYITECPYCGNRLRKRAPKIDRQGRVAERRRRRPPAPSLPRLKRGEIPGIRAESRPYATIVLVVLGLVGCLLWRTGLVASGPDRDRPASPGPHWWRLLTAPFVYDNTGFAIVTLGTIGLYGTLVERRHGPIPVIALVALGGIGGIAATVAVYPDPVVLGANGAALALLVAWAIPDLLTLRAGEEIEGDLLGTAVIAVVVALMPLVVADASWVADGVGVLAGVGGRAAAHPDRRALISATLIVPGSPATRRADRARRASGPRASGGTAASRPPEVIASTGQPALRLGDVRGERRERLRVGAVAAGAAAAAAWSGRASSSRTPSMAGTAAASTSAARPLASASSCRWPSRPKPVTSVRAWAPAALRGGRRVAVERGHDLDRRLEGRVVAARA